MKEVALYKGDDLLMIGTVQEAAQFLGVQTKTIHFLKSPAYMKRVAARKNSRLSTIAISIEG